MRPLTLVWLAGLISIVAQAQTLREILSRVSEEAEVFRHVAPEVLAEKTLTQRGIKPPGRFRPRVEAAATKTTPTNLQTREIISEYSLGTLKDAPQSLHEFRQVVSVDGRAVSSAASAGHTLGLGLSCSDDHAKKRMLEEL